MTSTGLVVVFAALMGVLALLAIAVDWIGKPIRNRKFQPRIYRYDDEQQVTLPGTTGFAPAPMPMPMPGLAPAAGLALPPIAPAPAPPVATGEATESPAALSALGLPEVSTVGTPQQQAGWLDADRNEWGGSTFALPDAAGGSWGQIAEAERASSFADLVAVDTLSTIERADIQAETLPAARANCWPSQSRSRPMSRSSRWSTETRSPPAPASRPMTQPTNPASGDRATRCGAPRSIRRHLMRRGYTTGSGRAQRC